MVFAGTALYGPSHPLLFFIQLTPLQRIPRAQRLHHGQVHVPRLLPRRDHRQD
jgi:hypothetical protein